MSVNKNQVLDDEEAFDNEHLISIVVPAYNAEDFLEKNVKTYLEQTTQNIEIVIVNDGSKDATQKIAEGLVKLDARVRLINKSNGGLSSARNAGVEAARGEYIFFIDPDDYMENDTLELLYKSLEESESDVAITGYDLEYPTETKLPGAWIQKLFKKSRQKFILEEYPNVLQASTAWGKLIRTSFYQEAGLTFIDGILYEDQPFTAKMYAQAKNGIDIIGAYKMHWVQRDDSISHQVTVSDLRARLNSARLALTMLDEFAIEEVYHSRLIQNLNNDLRYIMRKYNKVDEEYNDLIFETLPKFYHMLADKADLDAVVDVAYRLLDANDRAIFEQYLFATNISNYKLKLIDVDGTPTVDWSTLNFIGDFKSEGHVLTENFQPRTSISDFKHTENGPELSLQAYITKLDCHEFNYDVRLKLIKINEKTGKELEVLADLAPIRQFSAPDTIREHKEWWADYSDNFYTFQLPNELAGFNECVKLQVEMSAGNLHFKHDIDDLRNNGTGRWANMTVSPTAQLRLKLSKKHGKKAYYIKYVPIATYAVHSVSGTKVTYAVKSGSKLKRVEMKAAGRRKSTVKLDLQKTAIADEYLVTVDMDKLGNMKDVLKAFVKDVLSIRRFTLQRPKEWQFAFFNVNNNEILSFVADTETISLPEAHTAITNYSAGSAKLAVAPVVNVKQATLVDNTLLVDVVLLNAPENGLTISMHAVSGKAEQMTQVHLDANQRQTISLPLTHEVFGEVVPLPLAQYTITFKAKKVVQTTFYDEALVHTLPTNQYVDGYHASRIDFNYTNQKLRFQLFNKMADDNKGGYGWSRMMTRYLNSTQTADPRVILFRTYYGESVTDNAVALTHEILNHSDKDLEIYWAVQNQNVKVPEGTHQVIINSDKWFELLATAGTVVENVHQINYMLKKPGQRIVEAFHGYPYKQMGRTYYASQEYDLSRVKSFQDREAQWDYILSPAPYATPLYQDSFNFKGDILEVGHPRNDILVDESRAADRAAINKQVRERLNIGEDKKIVLYAPTYRDYASDTEFKSNRVDFVDYDKLAKNLGDEYVLLVRGHMMNRRAGNTVATSNVIDVTSYPEILDLIIASDMAVLDYSSLRFDYAQTGKPMIFLVPDLELYEETRGGLMAYLPTAPGWIVNTQSELIDAITHADDYMTLYGDDWRRFRREYTPLDDGKASARMIEQLFPEDDK